MGNIHLVTGYAGQEHVTAADVGAFNSALFGSGQFVLGKGNRLAASIVTNNKIRVLDGDIYMQGRHIRLNEDTYVDLNIENGAQGYFRNDLIVARYTRDTSTGVEDANLVVIKGTAVTSNPADPTYKSGDIINEHASVNDIPLYRLPLDGLTMGKPVALFTVFEGNIYDLMAHKSRHAQGGADALRPSDIGAATTKTYTATVTTSWSVSGDYYYQDITVNGILASDNPVVDIVPGSDNAANIVYAKNMSRVFRVTTSANSIRVWSTEAVNTAFPIQIKAVR